MPMSGTPIYKTRYAFHTISNYKFLISNLVLKYSPHFSIAHGTGNNPMAIKANKLFPHPRPKVSYICRPARGRTAPKTLLISVFAARALAA